MSKGILLILLIGIVNGGIIRVSEGDKTILSCSFPEKEIEDKAKLRVLWKKVTGEKVIWGNIGKNTTDNNRTIEINGNASLVIGECRKSDQGMYILCINGRPSCNVKLLITASKKCKRSAEKQCNSQKTVSVAQDFEEENTTETSYRQHYLIILSVVFTILCLSLVMVIHNKRLKSSQPACIHENSNKLIELKLIE